jgi:ketosteroid isomerase-like protein
VPADIQGVVAVYEGALEAKSLDRIRSVYPSLTADQASNWTSFFQLASKIKSEFRVSNILPATGDVATATVQGQLHFEAQGKSQDQPYNYVATFARQNGKWRIETIK